MTVFLTDADYKHTLGAIRSLGRRGITVIAGATSWRAQGFYSRLCHRRVVYPPPQDEGRFIAFMHEFLAQNPVDVFLPIGYHTTVTVSKHYEVLSQYARIPVAPYEIMEIASRKDRTLTFAEKLGVRIPKTYPSPDEVESFPVVVKGVRESQGMRRMRYVNSPEEIAAMDLREAVIQEYIPGEGYGFYALCNRGEIRAFFMHRRLREYPITGGPSTAAESIYDPALKALGERLLTALGWHGVAMVECKKDARTGEFVLMEVNPKFWGSLDLSRAAGIDFPYLAIRMALEGDVPVQPQYALGVRFRWLFPDDALHLAANPRAARAFFRDFFDRRVHGNVDLRDPLPNLVQMGTTVVKLATYAWKGTLRYPHGIPKVRQ